MAFITYNDISIRAVAASVPKNIVSNLDLGYLMTIEEIEKTTFATGIREKRVADKDVTSSDLCFCAAEKLINDNLIDRDSIDALIFVSQTPDYKQPSTAPNLQYRLGLNTRTLSFDINLACSGYVYGLSMAFAYASMVGVDRVLLLVGETMSKTISLYDRITTPLFGDAGSATLIEKKALAGTSFFSLNSDGKDSHILRIPFGGYRNPSSNEGFIMRKDEYGNILNGEQLHMDGMDVFNFAIRTVPTDIKFLLKKTGLSTQDIDLVLFHQANRFLTDFLAKRLKFDLVKIPYSIEKFGNTSSASIPLTISSKLCNKSNYPNREKTILSGFGAGLSWATALISLSNCAVSELIEY